MEPTPEGGTADASPPPPGPGGAGLADRDRPARRGVGLVAATRQPRRPATGAHPGRPGARAGRERLPSPGGAGSSVMPWAPLRYRLAIAPPDLGSNAAVARLEAPPVDDARVRSIAADLGVNGVVERSPNGGRQVREGTALLTLEPTPGRLGRLLHTALRAAHPPPARFPARSAPAPGRRLRRVDDRAPGPARAGPPPTDVPLTAPVAPGQPARRRAGRAHRAVTPRTDRSHRRVVGHRRRDVHGRWCRVRAGTLCRAGSHRAHVAQRRAPPAIQRRRDRRALVAGRDR